jgi:antitoxin component YwqK of YwqJK toxin-antitoxin module
VQILKNSSYGVNSIVCRHFEKKGKEGPSMRNALYLLVTVGSLFCSGCQQKRQENTIVSTKYIHKYGYAVSKNEFETRKYPGQVVSLLKNGVTNTATYENGKLHGVVTSTYPHSQTIELYQIYNQGNCVKEIRYDSSGMPVKEEVKLSPTRYATTLWYANGTPLSIEEHAGDELVEGQYFTPHHDLESRVEKGEGLRIKRDVYGTLMAKDEITEGLVSKHETFFANGSPESISYFKQNKLDGEKSTFTANGEPLNVKEYHHGDLHGKATFYKNGSKYLEIHYLDGKKNGVETHYGDDETISQEILWENDKRHGPTKYYMDGVPQIEYYYNGEHVSEVKWKEQNHIDQLINEISPEVQAW